MSQVDWSILGDTGSSACPSGQSIRNGISLVGGTLTKNAVQLSIWTTSIQTVQLHIPGARELQSATVYLSVLENGRKEASRQTLGTVEVGTDLQGSDKTFSNLKQNTRYTAVTHIGDVTNVVSRFCFKTPADLEIPLGSGRGGDGPGDPFSSGCYAFSKDPNQIRACFCGARNSSGSWARTDAEDGYEYMLDAAWRQNVGCTTN